MVAAVVWLVCLQTILEQFQGRAQFIPAPYFGSLHQYGAQVVRSRRALVQGFCCLNNFNPLFLRTKNLLGTGRALYEYQKR
jgi:hypothetical protein